MASSTQICNLALAHLGVGKSIANLQTEQSEEANACRRFYDVSLERTLRDFPWPFSKRYQALELVAENPMDSYKFAYRYPTGCVRIHRIDSTIRNDNRQSRVHFTIGGDSSGQLIYTDQEQAKIWFSFLDTDPEKYPADFTLALSFLIAHYIAPTLTAGDPFKVGERAMQNYMAELDRARVNAIGEEQVEVEVESEFIRARS